MTKHLVNKNFDRSLKRNALYSLARAILHHDEQGILNEIERVRKLRCAAFWEYRAKEEGDNPRTGEAYSKATIQKYKKTYEYYEGLEENLFTVLQLFRESCKGEEALKGEVVSLKMVK